MTEFEQIIAPISVELDSVRGVLCGEIESKYPWLGGVVREHLGRYGKLLRPILVLLSGRCCGGVVGERSVRVAATVEMVHSATLIHDDVIDSAGSRHGVDSLYRVVGGHHAVLVGDYLFSRALRVSSEVKAYDEIDVVIGAIESLVEGELQQAALVAEKVVDKERYMGVIRLKTGALIEGSVRVGCISAGVEAGDKRVERLMGYAERLGMVFQIQDDILDYIGEDENTGKGKYNDIVEGKVTLPLIMAIERGGDSIMSDFENKEVEKVVGFVRKYKGIEQAQEIINRLSCEAIKYLDELENNEAKESLIKLIKFAKNRNK